MIIREITDSDFDGLMTLYMQLHDNPFPNKTPEVLGIWNNILSDINYHIIVAVEDGKIVSSCTCIIILNLTRGHRPYALVENVVTDAAYRKRGWACGSRTRAASRRFFWAIFAPCSLTGASLPTSQGTKLSPKSLAVRCIAVFTEQIFVKTRKPNEGILAYVERG